MDIESLSQNMKAAVSTIPRRRGLRRLLRFLVSLVLLFVLALAGVFLWFYRAAHGALAQLDGTIPTRGLHAAVTVDRDAHGVPHLRADGLEDLFLAQGYVTAQDRLWQMDMARRNSAGEMAEILPAVTGNWLKHDIQQRTLGLRAVAENFEANLSQEERALYDAYARGVNSYIEQHRGNLPIEFRVLHYVPRPWTTRDCLLVAVGMNQLLNSQYEIEYWREKTSSLLTPELAKDLFPDRSFHDLTPFDSAGELIKGKPIKNAASPRVHESRGPAGLVGGSWGEAAPEPLLPGSNNWVVSGAHSQSGKPLLSNDMHLAHTLPGIWYEIHLQAGDFNVAGFSLPGMPFIIVGHNQRIAWGFTNLNIDVQDLFVENFNAAGAYQTSTGWARPEIHQEVVHVRGGSDQVVNVVITRHGPLISSLIPGETRKIALQWIIYNYPNPRFPILALDRAQNWRQFRQALSGFVAPSQNVVYADVDGHIGYQAMGAAPLRNSGDGTVPVSGADAKHDWIGYLPFEKLPSIYDPPSGMIATANARITPEGYPYLLATQWLPPYREERIYQVLGSEEKKFSSEDMLLLQTDVNSDYDRYFAQRFAQAIDHTPATSSRARAAAELLRNFDGRMLADSCSATIEVIGRRKLFNKLLMGKLGQEWNRYQWFEATVALENIIREQSGRWLPPGYRSFDELLADAIEEALKEAPADLKSWRFGDMFPVEINHPLFGFVPVLRRWAGPGLHPQSGGAQTVKQVGRNFGPSERMTVDLNDLDSSNFNLVEGESGQLYSSYYMDHWQYWYNGRSFALPFGPDAVKLSRQHELILVPE